MTGGDWHDPFAAGRGGARARAPPRRARGAPPRAPASRSARRSASAERPERRAAEPSARARAARSRAAADRRRAAVQPARRRRAPPRRPARRPDRRCGPPSLAACRARIVGVVVAGLVLRGQGRSSALIDGDDDAGGRPRRRPAKTQELHDPRGPRPPPDRRARRRRPASRATTRRRARASRASTRRSTAPRAPPNLEGFLFPATYELPKKATVKDLVSRQLDAFEANLTEVDLSYAESKNLNVYDVLKIASMIEREIQVPEERELVAAVIYNRLAAGDTARHRRDDPLRGPELRRAADREPARRPTRPTTPGSTRACRRPRSATPASPRSRRPRTRPRPTSSTSSSSPAPAASTSSSRPRRSSPQAEAAVSGGARGAGRLADRVLSAIARPMPRLAVLGQPVVALALAGDAERGAARELGLGGRVDATRRSRSRPRASTRWSARCRGDGFAGVNVTVPHKLAALAVADRASDAARAIGAANTLSFADGGIAAENTDADRADRRAARAARAACERWCSAPAARRAPASGRCASAGADGRDLEPHRRERAAALAAELGVAHERRSRGAGELPRPVRPARQRDHGRPRAGERGRRQRPASPT